MAWLTLFIAGCFEIAWALGLKYTHGFSRPVPSVLTIAAMVTSMWLLGVAAKELPIGTAYAVWVGIGATGAAIGGMLLFKEPASPLRLLFLAVLVGSLIGLKATTPTRS